MTRFKKELIKRGYQFDGNDYTIPHLAWMVRKLKMVKHCLSGLTATWASKICLSSNNQGGGQVAHFFTSAQAVTEYHEQLTINGDYSQIYRLFSIDDRSTGTPMW